MKAIELTRIELRGTDAQGRYAMAEVDGEWVGVSLDGEDECVRDLRTLRPGTLVEVGTEQMRVTAESFKDDDETAGGRAMKATIEISPDAVAYVFANAFHYEWFRGYRIAKAQQPAAIARLAQTIFKDKQHAKTAMLVACGGTVEVQALDPDTDKPRWYTVTAADFERGYSLYLAAGYRAVGELLEGSADVDACDCWLQLAVFGKLVYG